MNPDTLDVVFHYIALPIALLLTAHGVDDLFIDACYYARGMWRTGRKPLDVEALRAKKPQRIAMMVPAWQESVVIARMLQNALTTLDYDPDCFDIFVGTYPNDPATREKVHGVTSRAHNVHEALVPHDGPTSKADCLNAVYQEIKRVEAERGVRFDMLVMHDAEDVIHPLALRHYNYWIPQYDFVQTPVLPLEVPLRQVVAGTYIDEFTEHHLKDMIVRGRIGGLVPSAGVGSAFARAAFEEIAVGHGDAAFDVESLTEDYEIGLKMRLAGKKTYFACDTIEHERERRNDEGKMVRVREKGIIATREYFPTGFRASIRQRSRWILGIGFQTWAKVGWKGPLPVLYTLYRDRRALVSHLVALAAYGVVLYCIVRFAEGLFTGDRWYFDDLFWPGSLLATVVWFNAGLLAWRMGIKVATLKRVYGWRQSLMSMARFPVANVVSFLATASAARQYAVHKIKKRPLRWKKTEHVFPDMEPSPARDSHAPPSRDRVLLVEPDPIFAEQVERHLRSCGYEIVRVAEGRHALAILAETRVAAVICSLELPDLSGVEVAASCALLESPPPFVLTTQIGDPDIEEDRLGIETIVQRPCALRALTEAIERATGIPAARSIMARPVLMN